MEQRKKLGNTAENLARLYLEQQGMKTVCANYTCRSGEIDLILLHGRYLVFAEVRSKTGTRYGQPQETVNRKKQDKIRKTAAMYLHQNRKFAQYFCRFDVVSVVWKEGRASLEWIPDAFQ